jgi:homoprotocatechuate degradation regulator HpaR
MSSASKRATARILANTAAKPAARARPSSVAADAPGNGRLLDGKTAQALIRETALPVSLLRAREAVMAHMRPVLRAHGVTEQQWRVLRVLDAETPMDKTTLASRATLLMPSLLRILKDLEETQLIRLSSWSRNKRLSRVVLSPAGAALVRQVTAAIEAASKQVRARIGAEQVAQLLDLLHLVESRLVGFELTDKR